MFDDDNESPFPFRTNERDSAKKNIGPEGFTFRQAASDINKVPNEDKKETGASVSAPKNNEVEKPKPISALDKYKK